MVESRRTPFQSYRSFDSARLKSGLKAGLKSTLSDDVVSLNFRARTSAMVFTSVLFQKQIKAHVIDEVLEKKNNYLTPNYLTPITKATLSKTVK
jgi:hypothetical protein